MLSKLLCATMVSTLFMSQAYAVQEEGIPYSSPATKDKGNCRQPANATGKVAVARSRMSAWINGDDVDQGKGGGSVRVYFKKEDSGVTLYGPAEGFSPVNNAQSFGTHKNKDNSDTFGVSDDGQAHWISLAVPGDEFLRKSGGSLETWVKIRNARKGKQGSYTLRVTFMHGRNGHVGIGYICM